MPAPDEIVVIANPTARGGMDRSGRLDAFEQRLRAAGLPVRRVVTRGPGDATTLAEEHGAARVLVAAGGDGTFREVVEGVMRLGGPRPRVAALALGTGNDAAGLLGHQDDGRLAQAVVAGAERPLDLVEVRLREGGVERVRHAVLFAAVGFSGDLLRATTPRLKRWLGPTLSYPAGFFRALLRHQPVDLRVRTARGEVAEPLVVALIANAPHAGGGMMRIAPGASLHDGRAEVSLVRGLGRLRIASQFVRLVRGTHIHHPRVEHFPGDFLEVDASPAQPVALDGDLAGETPMRARLIAGAVRVVAA